MLPLAITRAENMRSEFFRRCEQAFQCPEVAILQPAMPTRVRDGTRGRVGIAPATYTSRLVYEEVRSAVCQFACVLPLVGGGWRATLD